MFEFGVFCVILLAMGYWTTLFIMGRREDVLHGQFVKAEAGSEPMPVPVSPVPRRPRVSQPVAPVASEPPAQAPVFVTAPAHQPASPPVAASKPSGNPEALQLLLASLKQELKNAAQI